MADNSSPADGSQGSGFHLTSRMVMLGVLVVIALIFVLQNTGRADFKFLFLSFSMPKWLMFIVFLALGMAIDRLVIWISRRRAAKAS